VFGVCAVIEVNFSDYNYTYKLKNDSNGVDKMYHQLPDEEEKLNVIEHCYDSILDEIEENLQRISQKK
jgi:hypothetical protein